jgi:hypothetical protein
VIVPSSRFGSIRVGEVASVKPDLPNAAPVDASVALVDRVMDAASNTFRVRLNLPNPICGCPPACAAASPSVRQRRRIDAGCGGVAYRRHAPGHQSAGVQRQASSLRARMSNAAAR